MKKHSTLVQPKYDRKKEFLFKILLLTSPILVFLFLELVLRLVHYGDNFNLFIDFPEKDYQAYKYVNPEIGRKYFKQLQYSRPAGDMFLKIKPENEFRIFVLGSSTVAGFPYDQNLMFSRILEERLQDHFPDKRIKVINTALTAINSFTLLDFTDAILKENPDAILIYAGHNEFYGAMGAGSVERGFKSGLLTRLHLQLLSFRFYQLLRNSITGMGSLRSGNRNDENTKGTLMQEIVNNKKICYNGRVYNLALKLYNRNLGNILHKAKRADVPVFISELVSNVKDIPPFCSCSEPAGQPASEAYSRAREWEQKGDFETARKNYYLAKDLDCIRFRASEEINDIIHELAVRYNAQLVPMKTEYFEKESPNGLIGNNLLTEHVHPNIDGYFLMADAFFNSLIKSRLPGNLNEVYFKSSAYYKNNWGYTQLDSLVAQHKVSSLMSYWPFKPIDTQTHFLDQYKPVSFIDSLSVALIKSPGKRLDEAHIILAGFYYARGDYYQAFREYYAALLYDPYQLLYYQNAIDCLLKTNDLNLALKLIDKSLELKVTSYPCVMKSEILFLKKDYTGALASLNMASKFSSSLEDRINRLLLLHKIYYYSHNELKAQEILAEIKRIDPRIQPNYQGAIKDYVYFLPVQVEKQVKNAMVLYTEKDFDAALTEFLKSLEIKETALANRCVGDILRVKGDSKALIYYQKAYPDYQNNPGFLLNMGILYLKTSQPEKVRTIIDRIKAIDAGYTGISFLENSMIR